ncbi:MAG: type II toxin-antitoxin system RelE/ParE family toxin [Chloroflexi bacterium]|nr:type II toxin-antitoxin system RelE/ParE family toxin [Chloroflexota bacterium]
MADYQIVFTTSARHELNRLEKKLVQRIFSKIENLAENPRPKGCTKLSGMESLWRIRIGDYRVVYSIQDQIVTIEVIAIRHRRDVYRY